ncbi:MAG: hypothetical protein PHC28_04800 [Flavobacterium sp.]|uniref:hypothetical protein n=1 Tax=Flavobacterium sp. TaxID=239 RepID=UPI0026323E61|nr:hypothetical protein [Flavobacterium sp.]MDD5149784.1 hypothetical protein [Flavobacterium sp.]
MSKTIVEHIPYTYLIGWSKLNKWYYGVRYGKNCNPNDLWKTYFTSSKLVKKFRDEFGEPDIIEIRRTFDCPVKATNWELKVLHRLKVVSNIKFINGHAGGNGYNAMLQAIKHTKGFARVYDNVGNKITTIKNDPRLISGELHGNRKGKLTVIDKNSNKKINISCNDYNKEIHTHPNTGKTHSNHNMTGKANYIINDTIVKIDVIEATKLNLISASKGKTIYKDINTNEILYLDGTDNRVLNKEVVGINYGKKLNIKNKRKPDICDISNKKEYILHNWIQYITSIDRPKKIKKIYSCICEIETKEHYDKAGWNRWKADDKSRITHIVPKNICYYIEEFSIN